MMMFWYIGGILAGFAIGYIIAIAQKLDRTTHKKGVNDCRNCKHLSVITKFGTLWCKKNPYLNDIPKVCNDYQHIGDAENEG